MRMFPTPVLYFSASFLITSCSRRRGSPTVLLPEKKKQGQRRSSAKRKEREGRTEARVSGDNDVLLLVVLDDVELDKGRVALDLMGRRVVRREGGQGAKEGKKRTWLTTGGCSGTAAMTASTSSGEKFETPTDLTLPDLRSSTTAL
jgi:hypothetical protein